MENINIEIKELENGIALVELAGFLDAHTFEKFDEVLNKLFSEGKYKIVVDMSKLEYISSAGAGVFIGSLGTAVDNGGNIVPMRLTANVKEVFELLGLNHVFTIVDSEEEAIKVFSS